MPFTLKVFAKVFGLQYSPHGEGDHHLIDFFDSNRVEKNQLYRAVNVNYKTVTTYSKLMKHIQIHEESIAITDETITNVYYHVFQKSGENMAAVDKLTALLQHALQQPLETMRTVYTQSIDSQELFDEYVKNLRENTVQNNSEGFEIQNHILKKYNGTAPIVSIPANVTAIGRYAFYQNDSIQTVNISEGVTEIQDSAFESCINLQTVYFPHTLRTIGKKAFKECKNLLQISHENGLQSIGEAAFYYCEHLRSITIPDTLESVGKLAFAGCHILEMTAQILNNTEFQVDENGFQLHNSVLVGYEGDMTHIVIPPNVTAINAGAFAWNTSIEEVTIPGSVVKICSNAFMKCENLRRVIIHEGLNRIEPYSFKNCENLCEILIPSSVQYIGIQAFSGCRNIELKRNAK